MNEVIKYVITVVGGGALWEILKFFYPEIRRYLQAKRSANEALYKNIDPILKSAGELYGKLVSLAKEDFSTFVNPNNSNSIDPEHNKKYVYYLFAQFWAHLENLRVESQFTSLSRIKKGSELLKFIETIESRKFRVLDRSMQRIIGECLITSKNHKFYVLTLNEFMIEIENGNSNLHKWIKNLEDMLSEVNIKDNRQIILRFGVIVAALIKHFDPKSRIVRNRIIYRNKLTEKSKKMIRTILFVHYLPFVKNKSSYY